MKITTQSDYGLRCLLRIAKEKGGSVSIEEICKSEILSADYIEQLLLRLRRAGFVQSLRGPGGGYVLSKPPKKISLRDVVFALENKPFELICKKIRSKDAFCKRRRLCKIKSVWKKINLNIENTLEKIKIADLV